MLTFGKNLQLKQDVGENGLDSCADNRDHMQAFVTLGMNFRRNKKLGFFYKLMYGSLFMKGCCAVLCTQTVRLLIIYRQLLI